MGASAPAQRWWWLEPHPSPQQQICCDCPQWCNCQMLPDTMHMVHVLTLTSLFRLPIGKHVFARAKVNGDTVIRSYTPVTDVDTKGCVVPANNAESFARAALLRHRCARVRLHSHTHVGVRTRTLALAHTCRHAHARTRTHTHTHTHTRTRTRTHTRTHAHTHGRHRRYFDLVLKIYSPAPPRFPTGGVMSQHIDSMKIGDTLEFSGPTGHIRYEDNGVFVMEKKKGEWCTGCWQGGCCCCCVCVW
jgi:hypothetical protein